MARGVKMTDSEYIAGIAKLQESQFSLNVPTIKSHIEKLKAIAQRLEDDEWQPIETAPKDGEMVLVNDTTDGYTPWVAASYRADEEWSGWVYDDKTTEDSNPLGPNPTHWLLIPELPISKAKNE
jgi:hypothetical protein